MRRETERPEAIEAGTVKLAGVEQENIVRLARELFDDPNAYAAMAHAVNPYGDGKTSARILQAIEHYFGLRSDWTGSVCTMKPHKSPSTPMLAAIGAAVLVGLLFLSYVLSSGMLHRKDTGIVLQSGTENAPTVSSGSQLLTAQSVADVTIGPDNAQKVIASLTRPRRTAASLKIRCIIPVARPHFAVVSTCWMAWFVRIG